jgi:hypothetical protein
MAFGPLEVAVGPQPADGAKAQQHRRQGVGHDGAVGAQHPVAVDLDPVDLQHPGEVRGVAHGDLEEQHRRVGRDGVHLALLTLLEGVLAGVAGLALVGDDVQPATADGLGDELAGPVVEVDPIGPQLGAAPHARHQRHHPDAQNEAEGDHDAVGLLQDVVDQGVDEHEGDQAEPGHGPALVPAAGGHRDRERGRDHHRQDPGGVRARLGLDVGPEDDGGDHAQGGVDEHHRPHGTAPLRRHPVAGQVAGDDVDQPGHGRRPGEPQDQDGADVIDGAEPVTEVLVG